MSSLDREAVYVGLFVTWLFWGGYRDAAIAIALMAATGWAIERWVGHATEFVAAARQLVERFWALAIATAIVVGTAGATLYHLFGRFW